MQKFGLAARILLLSGVLMAQAAMAAGHPPVRKATVAPPSGGAACMKSQLLSHAAYVPTAPEAVARCGHLLSTDTMLRVHRFGAT